MPTQDTSELKRKILFLLKQRGPSLPVHIARETGLSMLFASAFLSELLSERKIRISHMKVGSSPVYYIQGQEPLLANFAHHLNDKEKEAFTLLQNKKLLIDLEQSPAIRVALRTIKDFAIPFKKDERIFWRYYLIPENELTIPKSAPSPSKNEKPLGIFEKSKPIQKKKTSVKKTSKGEDKFFNDVKKALSSRHIGIVDIESFNKNELVLKIKKNGEEKILVAYNKRRISEEDLIKAHKKVSDKYSKYSILCSGAPLKKTESLIEAIKNLDGIEKI